LINYSKQVFDCTSLDDLEAPSKAFISKIASLTLKDLQVSFKSKELPPQQENSQEEHKGE
jgi:hypothetical protein